MSSIVTFYSYKGGVGRTMAMANVAVLLAQRNLKVLAVDWDLEAPGLERYFTYFSVVAERRGGLLGLLNDQQQGSRGHYREHLTQVTGTLGGRPFELDVLPSGREIDPAYSSILEHFDWEDYFANGGGEFIEDLRTRWRKDYDVVLIDSRTGLSDTGGICTIQLPDVVVAMFTANYQSLYGVRDTMRLAQSARDRLAYDRMRLRVLPVPTRFSSAVDTPEAAQWLDRIAEALDEFYQDWIPKRITARQVSEALRVPQVDAFGFGEKLAIVEEEESAVRPMTDAYERIADLLAAEVPDAVAILGLTPTAKPKTPDRPKAAAENYHYDLFVSHSGVSVLGEWVDAFVAILQDLVGQRLGRSVRIFLDRSELQVAEVWRDATATALLHSRTMLALVSPEFVASRWCQLEWAAFERREMERGPSVAPLIWPVCVQPTSELPDWIARRKIFDLSDVPRRASWFDTASPGVLTRLRRLADHLAKSIRLAPRFDPAWATAIDAPSPLALPPVPSSSSGSSEVSLDADALTALLKTGARPDAIDQARRLLRTLQRDRDFVVLGRLAGAILEHTPDDDATRLLFARALIETGETKRALGLLTRLVRELTPESHGFSDATVMLGRIHKQRFAASASKRSKTARTALLQAIKAYRLGFEANPENIWHGVNVVALLAAARRHGIKTGTSLDERRLAFKLSERLQQKPESLRTSWDTESLAELYLAQGDWEFFGRQLRDYVERPHVTAIAFNAFLGQLTDIWELDAHPQGAAHLAFLRARVLGMRGGAVNLSTAAVPPTTPAAVDTIEKIFGRDRTQSMAWFQLGLARSQSVGLVLDRSGQPYGTCFLVRARDFGIESDDCLALTGSHVVSSKSPMGLKPKQVTIRFGSQPAPRVVKVIDEVWTSPTIRLDATLLRLEVLPPDLPCLSLAPDLPSLDVPQRVYIIGYPGGRDVAFSLQDNELLDHEGPPEGAPPVPGIVRLHYRAPTAPGSSGSPLFDSEWRVIGLHRTGRTELGRLNRKPGTYTASEGIWIQSIAQAKK